MAYLVYLTHLDLSQSVLSLPVPDGEDVVIGVIYNAQCVSSILTNRKRHKSIFMCSQNGIQEPENSQKHVRNGLVKGFPYRLGESQADQGSVKEACAQNVECVEADRVPHTDMRSQLLPGK